MEWSQELCLQFIEDYRQYPELWRILDSNYKNKLKRNEALKELAEKYATSLKTVLNKIKSLRSYFHKEHSKIVKKKRESAVTDDGYVSNWFAYKSLVFILENDVTRSGRDVDWEVNNEDSDAVCDEPGGEFEDACSMPEDEFPIEDGKEPPSPSPAPKKTRKNDITLVEAYHYKPAAKKKVEERDEFAIFGEYIASKLRKMKDVRMQAIVQNRITNMLFEIEIGLLNCPGPSNSSSHPMSRNSSLSTRGSQSQPPSGGQLLLEPEITLVESNGANLMNFLASVPSGSDCNTSCSNKPLIKRLNLNRIMDTGLDHGAGVLDCTIDDKR